MPSDPPGIIPARLAAIELALERLRNPLERIAAALEAQPAAVNPITGAYDHEHIWGDPDTAGYRRCFCGAGQ